MADRFYSVVLGEMVPSQVTEGGSTSGEAIELRVNDSLYTNKLAVLNGLKAIEGYLQTVEPSIIS